MSQLVSESVTDKHNQWSDSGPIKKMKNNKSNLQDASPSPNTMTQWPNRPTLCLVEQRSILSILSHFWARLSLEWESRKERGQQEHTIHSPLFLPKWHLTHKSFMLLIVQRCPWPAIPQPPLFTKFLRPGWIDYLGHVIHIEGVCVPELIITTLAILTQTDALCIACPSAQVPPKPYRLKGFGQKQAMSEITKSYPLEIWRKLGRNRLMLLANYCLCNI